MPDKLIIVVHHLFKFMMYSIVALISIYSYGTLYTEARMHMYTEALKY